MADLCVIDMVFRKIPCTVQTIDVSSILTFFPPLHLLLMPKKQSIPHDNEIDGFSAFLRLFAMGFDRPTFSSARGFSSLFSSRFPVNILQNAYHR
jgi:hypothetical protein